MALAVQHALRSIAFPAISTGIYAYPREQAAVVASETIAGFLATDIVLEEVRFGLLHAKGRAGFLTKPTIRNGLIGGGRPQGS